jgi:uncharacterized protein (TIGR02246 family)
MKPFDHVGLRGYVSTTVILLALVTWPPGAGSRELGCVTVTEDDIINLFVQWNAALKTTPAEVAKLYAEDGILLPTVENGPLIGSVAIRGYFVDFLKDKPSGEINERIIRIGCNVALDVGLYTFTYAPPPPRPAKDPTKARYSYVYEYDGVHWLIAHHHSSVRPKE